MYKDSKQKSRGKNGNHSSGNGTKYEQKDSRSGRSNRRVDSGNKSNSGRVNQSYRKDTRNTRGDVRDNEKEIDTYVGSTNDPSWYNSNTRLISDVTKISFSNQLGTLVEMNGGTGQEYTGHVSDLTVPGIAVIKMMNTPGIAVNSSDGVNIAAQGLFQYVRKNLSTVAAYAPADVMLYVLGIDEIYSQYANITRLFGICNAYSAYNMFMPKNLICACYDMTPDNFDDLIGHLNDYRARFNNLILKASTLYLPTDFTITKRHAWLYSNYFVDGMTTKSQIYIHRKVRYGFIDERTYDTGTALLTEESGKTITALLNEFEHSLDAYRNSDSMIRIAADMRRAFEERSAWKLAYVDELFITTPIYDQNVLSQIHNLSIYPPSAYTALNTTTSAHTDINAFDVTQSVDNNTLWFNPVMSWPAADYQSIPNIYVEREMLPLIADQLVNFHKQEVTQDDILEATRNTLAANRQLTSPGGIATVSLQLLQTGVDICVGITLYTRTSQFGILTGYELAGVLSAFEPGTEALDVITKMSVFDWLPRVYINTRAWNSEYSIWVDLIYDLDNYSVIPKSLIGRINDNILTSMWMVPELGNYVPTK